MANLDTFFLCDFMEGTDGDNFFLFLVHWDFYLSGL